MVNSYKTNVFGESKKPSGGVSFYETNVKAEKIYNDMSKSEQEAAEAHAKNLSEDEQYELMVAIVKRDEGKTLSTEE